MGVLLYELLTGSTPFDTGELLKAGLDKIRQVIREREPARPSTRLSKMTVADLTTVALHRRSEPPVLIHAISGDLDWITMKALEKDRARRYETAYGLALDIERYLADEPVVARPTSAMYRVRKLMRRNKLAFAAGAAIAAILVLGLAASLWQAARANHEASHALVAEQQATAKAAAEQAAREDSEVIVKYMIEVFQSPDPTRDGRTITVAETLDRAAKTLEIDLTNQPDRHATLQATLASTYNALGLATNAIPLQEKVRDYYLKTLGPEHPKTLTDLGNLATSYYAAGRRDEALKLREQVLASRRKVNSPENSDTLLAMLDLAESYSDAGRRVEALKQREEVLTLYRKVSGPENPYTLTAMNNLALCYSAARRWDESLKLREEVLTLYRKVSGLEHPDTLVAMINLAQSYADAHREPEATRLQEEVLRLRQKVSGPEHPETLKVMGDLAWSYVSVGRKDEAIKLQEEALRLNRKVNGPEHPDTLWAMDYLAHVYFAAGRKDEAVKLQEERLAISLRQDPNSPASADTYCSLGNDLDQMGRRDEAIKAWQEALRINPSGSSERILVLLRRMVDANPADADKARQLATVCFWLGQTNEHLSVCRKLLDLAANSDDPGLHDRAAKAYLIQAHPDPETLKQAVASARRALQLAATNDSNRPWFLVTAAMAAVRDGKPAEAESFLNESLKLAGDDPNLRSLALAWRALARAHSGRAEKPRADVAELEKLQPALPAPPAPSAIVRQPDFLAVCLAHEEAKALLNPPPPPAKP
jgi:tetratricopeptide (TPR) repeat protein